MTRFLLALIAFYQRWISPPLHALSTSRCKFIPTCSEYAAVAIATHGPWRGSGLAAWRLLRCHPFTPGGLDPVPIPRPVAPVSGPAVAWASRPTHAPACVSPAGTARLESGDSSASQVPSPREPLP